MFSSTSFNTMQPYASPLQQSSSQAAGIQPTHKQRGQHSRPQLPLLQRIPNFIVNLHRFYPFSWLQATAAHYLLFWLGPSGEPSIFVYDVIGHRIHYPRWSTMLYRTVGDRSSHLMRVGIGYGIGNGLQEGPAAQQPQRGVGHVRISPACGGI